MAFHYGWLGTKAMLTLKSFHITGWQKKPQVIRATGQWFSNSAAHYRVAWGPLEKSQYPAYIPDQLNQNLWQCDIVSKPPQVILMCSCIWEPMVQDSTIALFSPSASGSRSESPGVVKTQIAGPYPQIFWLRRSELPFLTSSQVMLGCLGTTLNGSSCINDSQARNVLLH